MSVWISSNDDSIYFVLMGNDNFACLVRGQKGQWVSWSWEPFSCKERTNFILADDMSQPLMRRKEELSEQAAKLLF